MASIFKGVLLSMFISCSIYGMESIEDWPFFSTYVQRMETSQGWSLFSTYVQGLETSNPEGLYPHQQACLAAISRDIDRYPYGSVEMATGTGKTRTFGVLIRESGLRTLIVVPTTVLVEQTIQTISNLVPDRSISIFDGRNKDISGHILITTYASFCREKNADQFLGRDLVILDEVHYALSEKNIDSVNRLKSTPVPPKILGFTATGEFNTHRAEASFSSVEELLPHPFFSYGITSGLRDGILSPYRIVEMQLHNPELLRALRSRKPQKEETLTQWKERVLESLSDNAVNKIFPDLIQTFEGGSLRSQTGLIFTVSINHADALSSELNKVFGKDYACSIHSQTDKQYAKEMIEKHKEGDIKILVNVGVLTAGYDNPELGFIIDFKPTGSQVSLVQAFGRLLRTSTIPTTKTYIQLVVPELNHLKATDIFAREHAFPQVFPTTVTCVPAVSVQTSSTLGKRGYDQIESTFASTVSCDVFEGGSGYTLTVPSGEQLRVLMESVDPDETPQIQNRLQEAIKVIDGEWPEDEEGVAQHKIAEKGAIDTIIEISKNKSASLEQKREAAECLCLFHMYRKEAIEAYFEVLKHPKYTTKRAMDHVKIMCFLISYYQKNVACGGPLAKHHKEIYDQLNSEHEFLKRDILKKVTHLER